MLCVALLSVAACSSSPTHDVHVPNLVGKTVKAAEAVLKNRSLKFKLTYPNSRPPTANIKAGIIIAQAPAAGTMVRPHSTVEISSLKA